MKSVTKTIVNGRYNYSLNGELYRTSKREFKYACVATTRIDKGAVKEGVIFIISLGNNKQSTYNSMAQYYRHCDLEIIEIK